MSIKHTSQINKYAYYVHYLASNYEKQQKLPGKGALTEYAIKKVNARATLLHSGIPPAVKQEYAKIIGALYGQDTGLSKGSAFSTSLQRVQRALPKILDEKFNVTLNQITLEAKSGKVLKAGKTSLKNLKTNQKYFTEDQLIKLLAELRKIKIPSNLKKAEAEKLKSLLDRLYNETFVALQKLPKQIETVSKNSKQDGEWTQLTTGVLKNASQELQLRYRMKDPGLLSAFKKALLDYKVIRKSTTVVQGFSGEAVGAIAAELLEGTKRKTLDQTVIKKILTKSVVGGKNIKLKYIGVGPESHWLEFLKDKTIRNETMIISKRGSQQKVDIVVRMPENEGLEKNFKNVNISVKAVNLQRAIHVVSGTNLWYLIQEEQRSSFLRPYLNIMADHTDFLTNSHFSVEDKGKEMSSVARIMALRNDATKAIKIIAAYKAISGDTFGRTAAQLFVIKDTGSKKGKVYVLEISDIVRAILKSLGSFSPVEKFFDIDFSKSLELRNRWEDNLDIRMSEILKNCHENKINAALRFSEVMSLLQRRGQLITSQ